MKKVFGLLLCLFLFSCGSEKSGSISSDSSKVTASRVKVTVQSVLARLDKGKYKEGELLVQFKSGATAASALGSHKAVGATVKKKSVSVQGLELVKLPANMKMKDAIVQYMSDPNVDYAEPNYIKKYHGSAIPDDTYFFQQWALHNTGQYAGGTPGADIKAPEAWDITPGDGKVIIAVIDTGIDYNHPDLVGNIWKGESVGWNFVDNNNTPLDDDGHGTHVAGIIGAVGGNAMGTAGVMWHVRLMPLKFIGFHEDTADCGGGHFCGTALDEVDAIEYAIQNGAKIINASYGAYDFIESEFQAIADADAAGVIFVASAGNDGLNNDLTPNYPSSYNLPNIIAVAASDQNDRRAPFSNYGTSSVDVAAPGVYILSTVPTLLFPNGYDFKDGTSMAAPHVSGLAGLIYSYYTQFNHYQNIWTILRYSDPTPMIGWTLTGARINAYRALSSLLTPENLKGTVQSPSVISLTWNDMATGEDGYNIERKINTGSYSPLQTLQANTSSYTDSGLIDGTVYTYRVKAFNSIPAESFYSDEVAVLIPLNPPSNLNSTSVSESRVDLAWTDNSGSEQGFIIERQEVSAGTWEEAGRTSGTTFSDTHVQALTDYQYRIRAYNANGVSEPSNVLLVKTKSGGGSGGEGGGCSVGARQNTPTALADITPLLIPFIAIAVFRRRRY
jgi:serine protease